MAFVTANASRIGGSAFLLALSAITFLWFSSGLYRRLRRAEGESGESSLLAFAGGVVYAVFLLIGNYATEQSVTNAVIDKAVPVVQVISMIGTDPVFLDAEWTFPCVVLLGATGLVGLRTHVLPGWLVWATVGLAIVLLLGAAATYIPSALVILPALVLFFLWVVVTRVYLLRQPA